MIVLLITSRNSVHPKPIQTISHSQHLLLLSQLSLHVNQIQRQKAFSLKKIILAQKKVFRVCSLTQLKYLLDTRQRHGMPTVLNENVLMFEFNCNNVIRIARWNHIKFFSAKTALSTVIFHWDASYNVSIMMEKIGYGLIYCQLFSTFNIKFFLNKTFHLNKTQDGKFCPWILARYQLEQTLLLMVDRDDSNIVAVFRVKTAFTRPKFKLFSP